MNIRDYLQILLRRGWILVLAMVLTAGSAYVFSKGQTPVYRSEQTITILPARNDAGLTQTLLDLLNSYRKWMDSYTLAGTVIGQLHLDMTPEQLRGMITIASDRPTITLNVDVDMTNAEVASHVARAYGEAFVQWRTQQNEPLQLADRITAELRDPPLPSQIKPTTQTNTIAGALLGLLIGGVIVFVLETLSASVVRRNADVERYLQLPVLGSIPDTRGAL